MQVNTAYSTQVKQMISFERLNTHFFNLFRTLLRILNATLEVVVITKIENS